jgi:hypothetical protein
MLIRGGVKYEDSYKHNIKGINHKSRAFARS